MTLNTYVTKTLRNVTGQFKSQGGVEVLQMNGIGVEYMNGVWRWYRGG